MAAGFRIKLRNYRCFGGQPLSLEFGDWVTAFTGPNNVGKSSLLRSAYELRWLFRQLQQNPSDFVNQPGRGYALEGCEDPEEIIFDGSDAPTVVDIDLVHHEQSHSHIPAVTGVTFTFARGNPWPSVTTILRSGSTEIPSLDKSVENWEYFDANGIRYEFGRMRSLLQQLIDSMYIGPYRSVVGTSSEPYYDLVLGNGFVSTWNSQKTGPSKGSQRKIAEVTQVIAEIFGFKNLDIAASLDGSDLQLTIDGKPYRLREMGAGISQFIAVLGTVALKNPPFLFIDEPELHLHATLQSLFLAALGRFTQSGMAFSTHSLGLARAQADQAFSLRKKGTSIEFRRMESTTDFAMFAGEMGFNSYRELGYDRLLMVEGPSEVKVVQQFLRHWRIEKEVAVLSLGGSSLINSQREHELSELTRLTDKVAILIDSERDSDSASMDSEREKFVNICKEFGFATWSTTYRATENYFPDRAVKAALGSSYSALKPYERLKESNSPWGKSQNWRIAAEMDASEIKSNEFCRELRALLS